MGTPTPESKRTMGAYVLALKSGRTKAQARRDARLTTEQRHWFRDQYPEFAEDSDRAWEERRLAREIQDIDNMIYDPYRETPKWPEGPRLDYFIKWKEKFIGRPTPPHVMGFHMAYFDLTNRRIIWKGPTGSGKDTSLGDLVLAEITHDKGMKIGWLNESDPMATRRVAERIKPYLENPRTYEAPPGGPGCVTPSGSLIEDYGPFTWKKGLKYPNGDGVPQNTWEKRQLYFIPQPGEKEQDPNLSAAGINSALEGQRIRLFIMSDVFTLRNHGNPIVMADQINNIRGTIDNRLDGSGRVVLINSRIAGGDNVEQLEKEWVGAAEPIDIIHTHNTTYEKYPNGVAIVTTTAITTDDEGAEVPFWPANPEFPLDSYIKMGDERWNVEDLSRKDHLDLAKRGGVLVEGLRSKRKANPKLFATMQQQDPPTTAGGEFTEELLNSSEDETRSIYMKYPHEVGILGVDPARTYGAGFVKVAVNLRENTIIPYDYGFFEGLGSGGIKNKLVLEPLRRGGIRHLSYERNRESWVLDDIDVNNTCNALGVQMNPFTTGRNRNEGVWSVSAMAEDIALGIIRFPAASQADVDFMRLLKDHAENWDRGEVTGSKPGRSGHRPDDLWMAFWGAWMQAKYLLSHRVRAQAPERNVPDSVKAQWGVNVGSSKKKTVNIDTPVTDLVKEFYSA